MIIQKQHQHIMCLIPDSIAPPRPHPPPQTNHRAELIVKTSEQSLIVYPILLFGRKLGVSENPQHTLT